MQQLWTPEPLAWELIARRSGGSLRAAAREYVAAAQVGDLAVKGLLIHQIVSGPDLIPRMIPIEVWARVLVPDDDPVRLVEIWSDGQARPLRLVYRAARTVDIERMCAPPPTAASPRKRRRESYRPALEQWMRDQWQVGMAPRTAAIEFRRINDQRPSGERLVLPRQERSLVRAIERVLKGAERRAAKASKHR